MPTINPVTAASTTPTATPATSALPGADSSMFMKLLVENLRHQDPMQPQDSSAYMAQLSQMSMVEQMTALAGTSKQTAHDQATTAAVSLLGRTVTYLDATGARTSGLVQKVGVSADGPSLTIGGVAGIDPKFVVEVT